ncbi:MAG: hypothetical protein J2P36_10160 [Ktedonobacteraceae bacterium]|nr:hypothetical protein [Ktedonobacteraceae bacterium]
MKYSASSPITDIGLSALAVRALHAAHDHKFEDVANTSDAELASLRAVGPTTLKQLHLALTDAGLRDPVSTKPTDPRPILAKNGYVEGGLFATGTFYDNNPGGKTPRMLSVKGHKSPW